MRGTLNENYLSPPITASDEFIVNDVTGVAVAVINLETGNMFIKGSLFENQNSLSNPATDDFVLKDTNGNIFAYIEESGDFRIKGTLTENGNP